MTSAQFVSVGGDVVDLQSIKAIGDDCSDNIFLSTLDPFGGMVDTYIWVNYGGESGEEECWVDGAYETAIGVTFDPGQALWVEGLSESQAIQSSGQVMTADAVVQLQEGATMVGNPTPIAMDIQSIVCSGDDCSDNIFLSTLDAFGGMVDTYIWVNYGGESGEEECWVDGAYETAVGVTLQPGQGVWVEAVSDTQYVTFPGVEL